MSTEDAPQSSAFAAETEAAEQADLQGTPPGGEDTQQQEAAVDSGHEPGTLAEEELDSDEGLRKNEREGGKEIAVDSSGHEPGKPAEQKLASEAGLHSDAREGSQDAASDSKSHEPGKPVERIVGDAGLLSEKGAGARTQTETSGARLDGAKAAAKAAEEVRPAKSHVPATAAWRQQVSVSGKHPLRPTVLLGSEEDIKRKTSFASVTQDGVLKRSTFMTSGSSYRAGPKWTLGSKGTRGTSWIRSNSTPAPATYKECATDIEKFKRSPKFSFGSQSRLGLEAHKGKTPLPGPGVYGPSGDRGLAGLAPRDPSGEVSVKVGIGSLQRFKEVGSSLLQGSPGPGAYNIVGNLRQEHSATFGRSHQVPEDSDRPGPGTYLPSDQPVFTTAPKVGFGTTTRSGSDTRAKRLNLASPGPGAYELQNFRRTGSEARMFSIQSRRHIKDLNPYLTPGPGSYNAHQTYFGY